VACRSDFGTGRNSVDSPRTYPETSASFPHPDSAPERADAGALFLPSGIGGGGGLRISVEDGLLREGRRRSLTSFRRKNAVAARTFSRADGACS
jgi:hypothetical protein